MFFFKSVNQCVSSLREGKNSHTPEQNIYLLITSSKITSHSPCFLQLITRQKRLSATLSAIQNTNHPHLQGIFPILQFIDPSTIWSKELKNR